MALDMELKRLLIDKALEARGNSYSPYSNFCVGAALLAKDGEIIKGTNVENASFGATICAERSAFCTAISDGKRDFVAISIVGAKRGESPAAFCPPCGMCRQFMCEFCSADFVVLLYDGKEIAEKTLGELFPEVFVL